MPSFLDGDYSKYPQAIRQTFPYIAGETCELRQAWSVYHRLFMDDQRLTAIMGERLGRLLGLIQTINQDAMFLSIARLTDRDNRIQPNLSVWCLEDAVPFAKSPEFQRKIRQSLDSIWAAADNIRKHRHKRIAHFDRNVSLKTEPLPKVTVAEIRALIEMIESYLNLFFWEFEQTTMMFDMLPGLDITGAAKVTAIKAHVYDLLERNGRIPHGEWRKHWKA
jgi:NTP pyrophosphatase (non-canonical NTP hydrolase)